jgi:DNA-directed RNA polymerase specialized sigma24 family protein
MSWLYERRDQLDGLRHLVEIAYPFRLHVKPEDRDDIEQEIIITLIKVSRKHNGDASAKLLKFCARCVVNRYWRKKYRERNRSRRLYESNRGEIVAEDWKFVSDDEDSDARLDAIATLATLPQRLVEIGYKRLNGERLSEADEWYWMRHKAKLGCRKRGDQLSDWEKRRVVQLHNQGLSVSKIARTIGRSRKSIDLCLVKAGLREAPQYLATKG